MVIESANRILPLLHDRIAKTATPYLRHLGIKVFTKKMVTKVNNNIIYTQDGDTLSADLIIWAAGVKVDAVTKQFDGLEINKLNQMVVDDCLRTTKDQHIFALGDCAACTLTVRGKSMLIPPRAQAAHQQAGYLAKIFLNAAQEKPTKPFVYNDYGSLITISKYEAFGNLMSRVAKSLYIEGGIARFTYWTLYKKHQIVLWGTWRVIAMTIGNFISKSLRPKLKLH